MKEYERPRLLETVEWLEEINPSAAHPCARVWKKR